MFLPRTSSPRVSSILFGLSIVLVTIASAWSQATSAGTISGLVTDQQNAFVAGVEVKIVDPTTSSERTTITNGVGRYTFINVEPGVYNMSFSHAGFTHAKIQGQKVDVGSALSVDITLEVGATTTVVEVAGSAGAELQTLNATIGSTLHNDQLQLLPNLGRDASTLSVMQVGVSLTGNVAGAATDQNGFQLDGGYNSDDMAGTNTTYTIGNGYSGTSSSGGTPTGVMPPPSKVSRSSRSVPATRLRTSIAPPAARSRW